MWIDASDFFIKAVDFYEAATGQELNQLMTHKRAADCLEKIQEFDKAIKINEEVMTGFNKRGGF